MTNSAMQNDESARNNSDEPILRLVHLVKHFGDVVAVDDVSVEVFPGELISFLGPSGCGKTTLLRMIAGFSPPTAGEVWLGSRDVTSDHPYERATCMVFQNYALFPHMDVFHNVSYGLNVRKTPRHDVERKVQEALSLVQLDGYEKRRPHELSGGQQQRVALARALVLEPEILLLDEPLSNLDANLRIQMRDELRQLQQRLHLTVLLVTHDQEEAMSISDRILVLRDGRVQQIGTPRDIYEKPKNGFVAGFLGRVNLLPAVVASNSPSVFEAGPLRLQPLPGTDVSGCEKVHVVVRPEMLKIVPDGGGESDTVAGRVASFRYAGSIVQYDVDTEVGLVSVDVADPQKHGLLEEGQSVRVVFPPKAHAIPLDEKATDVPAEVHAMAP